MSATLCDLDNECGQGILLEMTSQCQLNLTVLSRPCGETWLDIANFVFNPGDDGFKSAESLISALEEWIRHTTEDFGIIRNMKGEANVQR